MPQSLEDEIEVRHVEGLQAVKGSERNDPGEGPPCPLGWGALLQCTAPKCLQDAHPSVACLPRMSSRVSGGQESWVMNAEGQEQCMYPVWSACESSPHYSMSTQIIHNQPGPTCFQNHIPAAGPSASIKDHNVQTAIKHTKTPIKDGVCCACPRSLVRDPHENSFTF